jgi:Flp pilus assembly protein TadG
VTPSRITAGVRSDRGSSVIELAILAPILLIIIFLTIQWALWFQARQVALEAAQQGARFARQYETTDPNWAAQASAAARSYYRSLTTQVLGNRITALPIGPANGVVGVTVTGSVPSLFFGVPLSVTASSTGPIECFRPDIPGGGTGEAC